MPEEELEPVVVAETHISRVEPWPEAHEIDTADTPEETLSRAERLLDT